MKKLFLFLLIIVALKLDAQYITNFANNVNSNETDGTYYYLPRNIVRLDFTIEKKQQIKGRFSSYAKEMLNTEDFINENKTSYHINNINVQTLTEADPNYVFFISVDEKSKDNYGLNLEMTSDGVLKSFGYDEHEVYTSENLSIKNELDYEEYYSEYNYLNIRENDDDDYDEEEVENITKSALTEKEIAQTVIDEIKKLRVAYFDLITGFQEVNYGESIKFMTEKIKEQEEEYLSMFIGETKSHIITKTVYIIPEEDKYSVTLGKFSDSEGFNTKTGETIKINFTNLSSNNNINKLGKDSIEKMTYTNKLFYRNPANVTMQVMLGDDIILEDRLKISQYGNIILLPMSKMKMIFDTNTGQLISVIKE